MPSVVWYQDSLTPGMLTAPAKLNEAVGHIMEYQSNEAQNDLRSNAPWTDRTGNARQGMFAQAGRTSLTHFIVLYHTMPYGVWLELKQSGKYAIIMPTIKTRGPQVMRMVKDVLKAMS